MLTKTGALVLAAVLSGVAHSAVYASIRASLGVRIFVQTFVALAAAMVAHANHTPKTRFSPSRAASAAVLYSVSSLVPAVVAALGPLSYAVVTLVRLSSLIAALGIDMAERRRLARDSAAATLLALTLGVAASTSAPDASQASVTGAVAACIVAATAAAALGELQRREAPALAAGANETLVMYATATFIGAVIIRGEPLEWHGAPLLAATSAAQHVCVALLIDVPRRSATLVPATLATRKLVTFSLFERNVPAALVAAACSALLIGVV